ncbi:MAG: GspE/PulE family protein [Burkholderiales bacterium]|jgi:type II secretory ATPase GspE/PulE/Tfp pilus assembly ATPase PilB-like protein
MTDEQNKTFGGALPPRLGDLLIELGLITQDQLRIALMEQKRSQQPLGECLLALGFATEEAVRGALADNLGEKAISLQGVVADPKALVLIPKAVAKRYMVFPVSLDPEKRLLVLASANPNDILAVDQISALLAGGPAIAWRLASQAEILSAIEQLYGYELSIDGVLQELESGKADLLQAGEGYSHPVVRLVDSLLADATLRGASDIHFEPEPRFLRIRYRIDGVLRQVRALHLRYWSPMAVRLKVMAGMNIAETRAPQDGRVSLSISGRVVDFRAAAQPTIHGENMVLRILDRKRGIVPIDGLGLSEEQLSQIQLMLARPEGILLVTGPTGSGKTTTLYSLLGHINKEGVNIMTLEDPVEYPMPMIRQTSVSDGAKIDFAEGIRSLMRQDPDIIMVGEVRDTETAQMAFRAAMTGHQVFSTLHTNSAMRAIARLIDMGITPEVMTGNIIGIVAQRLVRTLCVACKEPCAPSPIEAQLLGLSVDTKRPARLFAPVGCPECDHTGYRGRRSLMELLRFDTELDDLVARRASLKTMTEHLLSRGFVSLAADGLRRVREGETTIEEVGRVVDLTDGVT